MAKYHINAKGDAGVCTARVACPFGDLETQHWDSASEARAHFELQANNSPFAAYQKSQPLLQRTLPNYLCNWTFDDVVSTLGISKKEFEDDASRFAKTQGQSLGSFRARLNNWKRGYSMPLNIQSYLETSWGTQLRNEFSLAGLSWITVAEGEFPRQKLLDHVNAKITEILPFFQENPSSPIYKVLDSLNNELNSLERDALEWQGLPRALR